jgi:hypothetical protein
VPPGEGVIGEVWSSGEAILVNPDDPRLPQGRGSLPLMFSLKATAPARDA